MFSNRFNTFLSPDKGKCTTSSLYFLRYSQGICSAQGTCTFIITDKWFNLDSQYFSPPSPQLPNQVLFLRHFLIVPFAIFLKNYLSSSIITLAWVLGKEGYSAKCPLNSKKSRLFTNPPSSSYLTNLFLFLLSLPSFSSSPSPTSLSLLLRSSHHPLPEQCLLLNWSITYWYYMCSRIWLT